MSGPAQPARAREAYRVSLQGKPGCPQASQPAYRVSSCSPAMPVAAPCLLLLGNLAQGQRRFFSLLQQQVLQTFPWDKVEVGAWIVELGQGESGSSSQLSQQLEVLLLMRANGYTARPVKNKGVDMFFVKDKYWHAALLAKGWRKHLIGSWGC